VQALSGSPSWVVQPLSLVRAPKGRSGVAPAGTGAAMALFATAGEVAGLAMAFVIEVAADAVVAVTAVGGAVGRVDEGAVVGVIGSGVGGLRAGGLCRRWRGAGGTGRGARTAACHGNYHAHQARDDHCVPAFAPYETAAPHSIRTWLLHRSTIRAVLEQQASGVLHPPGSVQHDVHARGIFHKSVGRLHIQALSKRLCNRQSGLTSIAKDAHDLAGFSHYVNLPSAVSHASNRPTSPHIDKTRPGRLGQFECAWAGGCRPWAGGDRHVERGSSAVCTLASSRSSQRSPTGWHVLNRCFFAGLIAEWLGWAGRPTEGLSSRHRHAKRLPRLRR
jgi:hypothetical protein